MLLLDQAVMSSVKSSSSSSILWMMMSSREAGDKMIICMEASTRESLTTVSDPSLLLI